jgi:hypothetical protein
VDDCITDCSDMRRTANALPSLRILAVLTAAVAGCEIVPDRQFAALEKGLTVKIVDATRSPSGGSVDFSFELANHGKSSGTACLGPSRSVSYKVGSLSGTTVHRVDHAGCMREFTIQSGGVMSWVETLEVPRLPDCRAEVEVSVQIVNPRRCGSLGRCAAIDLKSNHFEIP